MMVILSSQQLFDYAHTPLDLMIYKMDNSYYVLKDMDPKLRKYGEAIVKEFGMKERFLPY